MVRVLTEVKGHAVIWNRAVTGKLNACLRWTLWWTLCLRRNVDVITFNAACLGALYGPLIPELLPASMHCTDL